MKREWHTEKNDNTYQGGTNRARMERNFDIKTLCKNRLPH